MTYLKVVTSLVILVAASSPASQSVALEADWTEPIPSSVIELFDPRHFSYSGGKYVKQRIAYRLYRPRKLIKGSKYPIIVWTAGYGERGEDNVGQLMHLDHLLAKPKEADKYQFYVLAMQNPPNSSGWIQQPGTILPDDPATIQLAVLDHVMKSEPIDPSRVYLAGISDGGNACWEMAMRYPSRFAAVAPLSSAGTDSPNSRLASVAKLPIWAFHCTRDPTTSPEGVRNTVAKLQALGGDVALTEIDSASHDCWTAAFRDYSLGEWLLSHQRGKNGGYPPGIRPWRWWHLTPLPMTVIVITLCWIAEGKRRAAQRAHLASLIPV